MKQGKLDPLEMQKWYPICGESFELENACALRGSFLGEAQQPKFMKLT